MDFKFKRSLVVLGQLARDAARTPPSEDDTPSEYIDRSLTILGRTSHFQSLKIENEFLGQRVFIASHFRDLETNMNGRFEESEKKMQVRFKEVDGCFGELEKRMDRRFKEVDRRFKEMDRRFGELEKRMDGRFKEVDGRFGELEKRMDGRFKEVDRRFAEVNKRFTEVNERFNEVDKRFNEVDIRFQKVEVLLENAASIKRNGRLRRMHQPISLIKILKPGDHPNSFVWTAHPQVPKHMKNLYTLGQRAKGIFEPSWDGRQTKLIAQEKALRTIIQLVKFYDVTTLSDEESESDAAEVNVNEMTADDYMEALLEEWGMDWQKVIKLGMQSFQVQSSQGVVKRAGDVSSRGEMKKARGIREENAD